MLELFEATPITPSPEKFRYSDVESPLEVAVRPKRYPMDGGLLETAATTQRPLTMFGLFSFVVLAVASLHLINFGNHSFQGMFAMSGRSGKNIFLSDKASFLRNSHRGLVVVQPRTFFMGEGAENDGPSFQPTIGRRVVLYAADDFSDVTQLYGIKSSDDEAIAGSIERKFFPMHETNADCVPMSTWQTQSFREYKINMK